MPDLTSPAGWLPVVFMALMALAMLLYVVLDGYDLGVGVLLRFADQSDRDLMIASIGPFWDANETWLVLGIGLLLVAFPLAHGVILTALYLPVAAMLVGLILRGVAFDFRYKARDEHRPRWDRFFWIGSTVASLAQGYMLGLYITGFERTTVGITFAVLISLGLVAGYALLGACWLLIKTRGELQLAAVRWARRALLLAGSGVAAVSAQHRSSVSAYSKSGSRCQTWSCCCRSRSRLRRSSSSPTAPCDACRCGSPKATSTASGCRSRARPASSCSRSTASRTACSRTS